MKWIVLLACGFLFMVADSAEARLFRRSSNRTSYSRTTVSSVPSGHTTSSAQGVAQIMASTGRVGHWGGNPGYEGCGSGSSAAAAYSSCCFSNSGMATVDVGYARGANGMWYCCRRYR
jgi:hypothetical protein